MQPHPTGRAGPHFRCLVLAPPDVVIVLSPSHSPPFLPLLCTASLTFHSSNSQLICHCIINDATISACHSHCPPMPRLIVSSHLPVSPISFPSCPVTLVESVRHAAIIDKVWSARSDCEWIRSVMRRLRTGCGENCCTYMMPDTIHILPHKRVPWATLIQRNYNL